MSMTVLRLRVAITAGDAGGSPLDGHRASLRFGERTPNGGRVLHDGVVVYEDARAGDAGEASTARVWVFAPDDVGRQVGPGTAFDLVEGGRSTARAEVLEVLTRIDESVAEGR